MSALSREDNGLLRVAEVLERGFYGINHGRGTAEENTGVRGWRREVLLQRVRCDAACAARPSGRGLFQDMVTVKVRKLSNVVFPFLSENNVRLGLIRKDQEELYVEPLVKNPPNNGDHGSDPGTSRHKSHTLCHAIDPMPTWVWPTHEHRVSDALVVQVLRHNACIIPFHREIEETPDTR